MSEEPEKMLEQEKVAAAEDVEKAGVEVPVTEYHCNGAC
jgi:hypothetical protein